MNVMRSVCARLVTATVMAALVLSLAATQASAATGYISFLSHTNGATYEYRLGTVIPVTVKADDPENYGLYKVAVYICDKTNSTILKSYFVDSYVVGSSTNVIDVETGGLAVSAGRYSVDADLWDMGGTHKIVAEQSFNLTVTQDPASISGAILGSVPPQTYTGGPITPPLTLTYAGAVLVSGVDYNVTYSNNVNVGTASAVITGIGKFFGTLATTFAIVPAGTPPVVVPVAVPAPVPTKPKVTLTTPVAPATMYRARYKTVYGYLKPRHTAGSTSVVRIYRYKRNSRGVYVKYDYVRAKLSNYSTYSKYTKSLAFPSRGKWRIRAYAPADTKHAATWSKYYDYVTVK